MQLVYFALQVALGGFVGLGVNTASTALGFDWPIAVVVAMGTLGGVGMVVEREKREACSAVARHIYLSLANQGFVADGNGKWWKKDKIEFESRAESGAGV